MSAQSSKSRLGPVDRLSQFISLFSGAACLVMGVHVVVDVLSRAIFNSPLGGTIDYVQYWWMPCIAFLAMAHTQALEQHLRVTILVDRLSPAVRRQVDIAAYLLSAVAIAALVFYGWIEAVGAWEVGEAALGTVVVPIWPLRFVAFIGLLVFFLQILVMLGRAIGRRSGGEAKTDEPSDAIGGL